MRAAYRDDEYGAHLALDALLEQRHAEIASLPEAIHRIHARRVARSMAGITAICAAVVIALMACATLLDPSFSAWRADRSLSIFGQGTFTLTLLLAWAAVAVAYLMGRIVAGARLRAALAHDVQQSDDIHAYRARLEQASPRAQILQLLHARERRSLALPLAGLMLLLPLTVHFVVYLVAVSSVAGRPRDNILENFNLWIVWSVFLTGFAHAVLAYLAFRYARRLSETPTSVLATGGPPGGAHALGVTVLASLLPGGIVYLIPPILVALTGVITILGPFAIFRRRLAREREALSVCGARWA